LLLPVLEFLVSPVAPLDPLLQLAPVLLVFLAGPEVPLGLLDLLVLYRPLDLVSLELLVVLLLLMALVLLVFLVDLDLLLLLWPLEDL
jgi:hypothetical protein